MPASFITRVTSAERASQSYEAMDSLDIRRFLEFLTPDAEYNIGTGASFRGHDEIMEMWKPLSSMISDN